MRESRSRNAVMFRPGTCCWILGSRSSSAKKAPLRARRGLDLPLRRGAACVHLDWLLRLFADQVGTNEGRKHSWQGVFPGVRDPSSDHPVTAVRSAQTPCQWTWYSQETFRSGECYSLTESRRSGTSMRIRCLVELPRKPVERLWCPGRDSNPHSVATART